jgi:lipoyl-dependent peroxiredoxin
MASTQAQQRTADVRWQGDLQTGSGTIVTTTTGRIKDEPVSWLARSGPHAGKTSPEELIAAAHASCFAMAFAGGLTRGGTPPKTLDVSATVTFDKVGDGWKIASSALRVRGEVPGIDGAAFVKAAEAAKDGCPVSSALKGNVALSVDAALF